MKKRIPGSRRLRVGRKSLPSRDYYLTKNAFLKGSKALVDPEANAKVLVDRFFRAAESKWLDLYAFVVMPDHFHLLIRLGEVKTLGEVMNEMCRLASRNISSTPGREQPVWQDGYHDRLIEPGDDAREIIRYIHANPVKKGLVKKPEDWPFSSAHSSFKTKVQVFPET